MQIKATANGKKISMTHQEWVAIGQKAGWENPGLAKEANMIGDTWRGVKNTWAIQKNVAALQKAVANMELALQNAGKVTVATPQGAKSLLEFLPSTQAMQIQQIKGEIGQLVANRAGLASANATQAPAAPASGQAPSAGQAAGAPATAKNTQPVAPAYQPPDTTVPPRTIGSNDILGSGINEGSTPAVQSTAVPSTAGNAAQANVHATAFQAIESLTPYIAQVPPQKRGQLAAALRSLKGFLEGAAPAGPMPGANAKKPVAAEGQVLLEKTALDWSGEYDKPIGYDTEGNMVTLRQAIDRRLELMDSQKKVWAKIAATSEPSPKADVVLPKRHF